jgi:signal transduction histidine kinase/CheY-like chemotaxis protein
MIRQASLKYAAAVAIAAVAIAIRWSLIPIVGPDAPYATLMGAIALAVWLGGWGPGVVTAVLGPVGMIVIIGRPFQALPFDLLHTSVGVALYLLTSGLIIGLGEAMRRTRDAYRQSQERFFRSQEAAIQGYAWLHAIRGPDGQLLDFEIEYINSLGASICQSTPEQVIGCRVSNVMPGLCTAGLLESLREVVRTGKPADIELSDVGAKAGLSRWLRCMIVRLDDGVAMCFSDITQTRQLAIQLSQRAAELQRANAAKSTFLATLSHELRNPLAPIRNGLAILKERTPESLGDIPAMMEQQIRIATRLIDDLLDASRIDRGKLELRRERIVLKSVIEAALETARPNIEAKAHELVVNHPAGDLYVDADRTRLAQVLANLLNNAAKFTAPQGRIALSVRAKAGIAIIRVQDSGIGIPAADLDNIFEMFVQLDTGKAHAGVGLGVGLALARSLINMHGGELTARSAGPGKGSEFRIRLPLAEAPAWTAPEASVERTDHTSRIVLVVDDNVDAATSLATLLDCRGHRTYACFDGLSGFEQAMSVPPEVAFIDLNMPFPDGFELCRMIRRQSWGAQVRLIALTGMGQPDDIERSRAAGFDLHLTKPVDPDDLCFAVGLAACTGLTAPAPPSTAEPDGVGRAAPEMPGELPLVSGLHHG